MKMKLPLTVGVDLVTSFGALLKMVGVRPESYDDGSFAWRTADRAHSFAPTEVLVDEPDRFEAKDGRGRRITIRPLTLALFNGEFRKTCPATPRQTDFAEMEDLLVSAN